MVTVTINNAVAESFFQLLKRERIKKKIYGTREEARSDIFDYIEMFYNSKRRHGSSNQMSPTEYENQFYQRLGSVWIIRGDSGLPTKFCVAYRLSTCFFIYFLRCYFSWHYPNSPKNLKTPLSPCHVWLCAGSGARKILYEFCFIRNNAG